MKKREAVLLFCLITPLFQIGILGIDLRLTQVNLPRASNNIITIHANGVIEPPNYPIHRDGDTYYFTGDIQGMQLEVKKSDITINGRGFQITPSSEDYYGIKLHHMSNVTVKNLEIGPARFSISLSDSSDIIILRNTIISNYGGIRLSDSSGNIIVGNSISTYYDYCMIFEDSSGNIIVGNNITRGPDRNAIWFDESSNNILYQNNIYSMFDPYTSVRQVRISSSTNTWDNGAEGNYWGDYTGSDSDGDGIGDDAYIINEGNLDRYPLMSLWNSEESTEEILARASAIGVMRFPPFWMQWWLWTAVIIIALATAGTAYYLKRR